MNRANETTLQKLTDQFNSSQSDVKVNLVNQIDYVQTFTKYKAGLSSGDLPDIVQLQETEQQQMIDTGTVLPASVCAKADKYSFSDFLPRVICYFTVQGKQYAMPFNTSGPVLYYNKKAFTAAGLDPTTPPKTLDEVRAAAEKLKANGVSAPLGLKTEPGYFEHWRALANKLYVNNSNGRKARATKTVYDDATGRQIFTWLSGMVKDGLATTNPDLGTGNFDNLLGIQSGSHAMAFDTSAALGTIQRSSPAATPPTSSSASRRSRRRDAKKGGVLVSGGELFMVNKCGAGEAGGGVEVPEVPRLARERDHVGDRHRLPADPQGVGRQHARCSSTGSRTRRTRSPTTSCSTARPTWPRRVGDRELHRRARRAA